MFNEDLNYSLDRNIRHKINEFYFDKFPMLIDIQEVEELQLQKKGVDIILHFEDGKKVYIEEKLRREDYGDIFLEVISNSNKMSLGWVLTCGADYICYIVQPTAKVYLLPVAILKTALLNNYDNWIYLFGAKKCYNRSYFSVGLCIDIDELFKALQKELVNFM